MTNRFWLLCLFVVFPLTSFANDYTANPDTVDFGVVWVPQELDGTSYKTVTLHSTGTADLLLHSITLPDTVTDVSLGELPELPFTLPSGDSLELTLTYSPSSPGNLVTALRIDANTTPELTEIPVRGQASQFPDDPGTLFWQYSPPEENPPGIVAILPFRDIDEDGINDLFICRDNGHHLAISGASSGDAVLLWETTTLVNETSAAPRNREQLFIVGENDVMLVCADEPRGLFLLSGDTGDVLDVVAGEELPVGEVAFVERVNSDKIVVRFGNQHVMIDGARSRLIMIPYQPDSGLLTGFAQQVCFFITGGTIWEHIPLDIQFFQETNRTRVALTIYGELDEWHEETSYDGRIIQAVGNLQSYRPCYTLSESGEIACWAPRSAYQPHFNEPPALWATEPPADRIYHISSTDYHYHGRVIERSNGNHLTCYSFDGRELWNETFEGLLDIQPIGDLDGNTFQELMLYFEDNRLITIDPVSQTTTLDLTMSAPVVDARTLTDLDFSGSRELVLGLADGSVQCVGGTPLTGANIEPDSPSTPTRYSLAPPWPNPFNASMTVRYEVPQAGQVMLELYNLLGQRVALLDEGFRTAGAHQVVWQGGEDLSSSSGTYFVRMQADGFEQVRRVTLLK